jgi:hypothetical protein
MQGRFGPGGYTSMVPLFNPMMAACVRSLAFSFEF